jgi:23S rRNA pseudouridine1911/1915/1917 synthase
MARQFRLKAKREYSRLDLFLNEQMTDISRTQVGKLIKENHVTVNDRPVQKKNITVMPGDIVAVELTEPEGDATLYQPSIKLDSLKLYEDDYLLVVDKPAGISVHPGSGAWEETILDVFKYHYPQVENIATTDTERPGIVHRLDKETSGVLLLAKDTICMKRLQKQFKRRDVKKTYLALVSGRLRFRSGTIDVPLIRSQRNRTRFRAADTNRMDENSPRVREAVTHYRVARQFDDFALIKVFPLTGRTHQIRVHFSHLGKPVLGDRLYGKPGNFPRLALHAYSLEFFHPITGQVLIACSSFPAIFREFLKKQYR